MEELELKNQEENKQLEQNEDKHYLDTIKYMQETMVSKEKYDKMVKERNDAVTALSRGEYVATENPKAYEKKNPQEIMKEQAECAKKGDQCGYVEKALEFRERILEEYGIDCFVPQGQNINNTQESYNSAQKTADIYRECLDYAGGNSQVLINEIQRRMPENNIAAMANAYNKNNRR